LTVKTSRANIKSRWSSHPHAAPGQLESERRQQFGDTPAAFVLPGLNLNLSERRIGERLPCPGKDLLGEAGHIDLLCNSGMARHIAQ
jgi:hypothetical protein